MEQKLAVFPGSFNPFTKGHLDIVEQALAIFDYLIVLVATNTTKSSEVSGKQLEQVKFALSQYSEVEVKIYQGLTSTFCKEQDIPFIVRGIRDVADFTYENRMANMNQYIAGIKTVFFMSRPEYSYISSSVVREIASLGGSVDKFLP